MNNRIKIPLNEAIYVAGSVADLADLLSVDKSYIYKIRTRHNGWIVDPLASFVLRLMPQLKRHVRRDK